MFLRNAWYVFGWESDLVAAGGLLGRTLLGEPVAVWCGEEGKLHATEDRCPHRHAPLSRGTIEGNRLRCGYHGLVIGADGRCQSMPLLEVAPDLRVRTYPVAAKDSWIWVWMGDTDKADTSTIPDAFGLDNPDAPMRSNSIEYDAHYQLVHDNLCDLSHVDFVHATTLKVATGVDWSATAPRVRMQQRSIRIERWFEDGGLPGMPDVRVDVWSTYDFFVPGIFVMRGARYPAGTAAKFDGNEPLGAQPIVRNIEQQAVTPISEQRTAYHYATGLIGDTPEITRQLASRLDVFMATFEEDRAMIEAQQKIWDLTPSDRPKHFMPQDKAPFMMRQLMARLIDEEQ
jgi:vanillate O-demethylase monooxygenase subunit